MSAHESKSRPSALIIGAIGVVFGDIGTSPLYALKETFAGHHPMAVEPASILGVLSLIFWTIMASARSRGWRWSRRSSRNMCCRSLQSS